MHRFIHPRLSATTLIAACVAVAVAGGVSYAATGGLAGKADSANGGKLYACVTTLFHTLNLSSASATCPSGQQKISWNAVSEPGTRGPRGATGAHGMKGDIGATGLQGATGPQGATGATGPQGAKGASGATGAQGPNGDTGATGATGLPGSQGPAGPRGPQGPPGPVHQLAGTVLTNCTLQSPITGVAVIPNPAPPATATGCTITFPASDFTNNPILMLTPINATGGNPTAVIQQQNADGSWSASYTFGSSPPPLLNFIASQLSS